MAIQKTEIEAQTKGSRQFPNLIVKTSDIEYPHLAENEYLCMSMAKACGISTPKYYLSDNKELFIVERFNLVNKERLGMEDFRVLSGRPIYQKRLFELIQTVDNLFEYVTRYCVGMGDAHLKNFSLLYSFSDEKRTMRLSLIYDVVNTTCYPELDKVMPLKMNKSNSFPTHDELVKFGRILNVNNPGRTIEKFADTISDHLNKPELWDDLSFLKNAITSSVSQSCSTKSSR